MIVEVAWYQIIVEHVHKLENQLKEVRSRVVCFDTNQYLISNQNKNILMKLSKEYSKLNLKY